MQLEDLVTLALRLDLTPCTNNLKHDGTRTNMKDHLASGVRVVTRGNATNAHYIQYYYSGICLIQLLYNPKFGLNRTQLQAQIESPYNTYSVIRNSLQSVIRRCFPTQPCESRLHNPAFSQVRNKMATALKRGHKELSVERKVKLITASEAVSKPKQADLSTQFGIGRSTISNILRKRDQYMEACHSPDLVPACSKLIQDVEHRLVSEKTSHSERFL